MALISGCGISDVSLAGKQAIKDQVRRELTRGNCDYAIDLIDKVYSTAETDNDIRILRASAYGCKSGMFFSTGITTLMTLDFTSNQFWADITQAYYSVQGTDTKMEAAMTAHDTLLTVIPVGTVLQAPFAMNLASYNPGTVIAGNRTDDSNLLMMLMGFAVMGSTQARYGDPDNNYIKQTDMPWISHDTMEDDGCTYAAAMANIVDASNVLQNKVGPSLQPMIAAIGTNFGTMIDTACDLGCKGLDWDTITLVDNVDCTVALVGACATCPKAMREKTLCMASDQAKCAAAGIVRFVNGSPAGWN